MDDFPQPQHPAATEESDDFVRESLPRPLRSWPPTVQPLHYAALAALLVVAMVAATAFLIGRLQTRLTPTVTASTPQDVVIVRSGSSVVIETPRPSPSPQELGWTQLTPAAGDVRFSVSDPQRGYLCGIDANQSFIFGTTADGGQTWIYRPSPAAYEGCTIQIAPTNPLDIALTSQVEGGGCAAPCPPFDVHYSTDGGVTWLAAPVPPNTVAPGGALWSAGSLYVWAGANASSGQSGFLKMSAYGAPFAPINLGALLPGGVQHVSIVSAVAGTSALYLTLTYDGCSSPPCQAIVASGDGFTSWTRASTQPGLQLMYVVGNTLYGQAMVGAATTLMYSIDSSASWHPLVLPPLPAGLTLTLGAHPVWLPTPDGLVVVVPALSAIAYLHGGAWTLTPFSSALYLDAVTAVSSGANGQPHRLWGVSDAQAFSHGIYWHALP
jgi:hypothetical protein